MKSSLLCCFFCLYLSFGSWAQERVHTISLDSTQSSPHANIEEVSWITGHWQIDGPDGFLEEVWLSPKGGAMLGSFQWITNEEVYLYELLTISEADSTLRLGLRHFDGQLHAWEEKNSPLTFPLVKLEPRKAYFNNFTFESPSEDQLNVYVLFKYGDGTFEEKKFSYRRVQP